MGKQFDWISAAIGGGGVCFVFSVSTLCYLWYRKSKKKENSSTYDDGDRNDNEMERSFNGCRDDAIPIENVEPNGNTNLNVNAEPNVNVHPIPYEELMQQQEQLGIAINSSISPTAYSTVIAIQTENDRNESCAEMKQLPLSDVRRETYHWKHRLDHYRDARKYKQRGRLRHLQLPEIDNYLERAKEKFSRASVQRQKQDAMKGYNIGQYCSGIIGYPFRQHSSHREGSIRADCQNKRVNSITELIQPRETVMPPQAHAQAMPNGAPVEKSSWKDEVKHETVKSYTERDSQQLKEQITNGLTQCSRERRNQK